jgi:regulatory protein
MAERTATPPTDAQLEAWALDYVSRYGASTARLSRALQRRLGRLLGPRDAADARLRERVAALVGKLAGLGYVNDAQFAESRVRALRRRGKSARAIRAALSLDGLEPLAREALASDGAAGELAAARGFVRKRRLGPHREPSSRELERQRDLARLARAGFSRDVALAALAFDGDDAADDSATDL